MFGRWPTVDGYSRGGGRHTRRLRLLTRRQLRVRWAASGAASDGSCSGVASGGRLLLGGGTRVLGALGVGRKQQDQFGSIPIEMGIFGWDP
jgi:hypothetical protein